MNRREATARLATFFPSGGTDEKCSAYLLQLHKENLEDSDIEEAVEELIKTRDAHAFPPFSVLSRHCAKAKHARMLRDPVYRESDTPAWLRDPRVRSGVCRCDHGLGMHGPAEGGYGEPMLTGNCRRCACPKYNVGGFIT